MRFEYAQINLCEWKRHEGPLERLQAAGDQGWELIGITHNGQGWMKRKMAEPVDLSTAQRFDDYGNSPDKAHARAAAEGRPIPATALADAMTKAKERPITERRRKTRTTLSS